MNQRRSERVHLQVRLAVIAEFEPGRLGRVEAFTIAVNAHGGLLEMNLKLRKGRKLVLMNPASGAKESATVVDVRRDGQEGFAIAFEFDKPAPRFWPISFPPKDWAEPETDNH